jgi:hypothetical protein
MKEEKELQQVLSVVFERRKNDIQISPAWLATETMHELDPENVSPRLVYVAAHLELRQLARALCRRTVEDSEQHELFPHLQRRYPIAHESGAEPVYKVLEHLTNADLIFNVRRLRAEASAKTAHSDALEAYRESRFGPMEASA